MLPLLFFTLVAGAGEIQDRLAANPDFVNVSSYENVFLDMRYATSDNFLGRNVYGDFSQCYLHKIAAEKFRKASQSLAIEKPGWKFRIFDCLRPRSVQRQMWRMVVNTPQQAYVAEPERGSVHNFGFAMDIGLQNADGESVDMGTSFDYFGELAEPRQEARLVLAGKLTAEQVANRKILRRVMVGAGFIQLPNEWWHFDALSRKTVTRKYTIFE